MPTIDDEATREAREYVTGLEETLDKTRAILNVMVDKCPRCQGKGFVKKWLAKEHGTYTGRFHGYQPCPYCHEARKLLGLDKRQCAKCGTLHDFQDMTLCDGQIVCIPCAEQKDFNEGQEK